MFGKKKIKYEDDFLKNLIQKTELDSPSKNFVDNVMYYCQNIKVEEPSFEWIPWMKQSLPWVLTSVFFISVIVLSLVFNVSIFSLIGLKVLSTYRIYHLIITGAIGLISGVIILYNKYSKGSLITVNE